MHLAAQFGQTDMFEMIQSISPIENSTTDLSSQEQCITVCGRTLLNPHLVSLGSMLGEWLYEFKLNAGEFDYFNSSFVKAQE